MARSSKKKGKPFKSTKSANKKNKRKLPHVQEALSTKVKLLLACLLAVLAIMVYSPSYNYEFVYDDDAVVKDNRYVKEGIGGLGKIWTTTYFKGYDENMNARAFRPIPLTTLAIEYEIWGLNATVNHIFNLLFYGATAFFLFLFLAKLLREHHPVFPLMATLLFILHPIHLEVVANIKSRDTMLGFVNLIIALWFLLKHIDNRKLFPLLLSFFFFSIALFSKEEVITSIVLIPAMMWCFRKLKTAQIIRLSLPFGILALLFIALRFAIIGGVDEGVVLTKLDNSLLAASGFAERSASNLLVIGHYLLKTIWPHPLISDYSFSTIPLTDWGDYRVYLALLINLGLFGLALFGVYKKKAWGFFLFWYFASVSIFTSLVTTNVSAYNDRFLYTPVLGICLLFSWILTHISKREGKTISGFIRNNLWVALVVLGICGLSVWKIESHLPNWQNRYVLFEHDAKLTPNNARTRKNHGGSLARKALENQNKDQEKLQSFAKAAIVELEAALSIYPDLPTGHIHKGNMHLLLKEYQLALTSFAEALRIAPNNYFAKSSMGIAYYSLGQYQKAIEVLESIPTHLRRQSDLQMLERCRARLN